jgi:hypothetical protein
MEAWHAEKATLEARKAGKESAGDDPAATPSYHDCHHEMGEVVKSNPIAPIILSRATLAAPSSSSIYICCCCCCTTNLLVLLLWNL